MHLLGPQNRAESTVLLHVSHSNLKARFFELRLDRHVRGLKGWQTEGFACWESEGLCAEVVLVVLFCLWRCWWWRGRGSKPSKLWLQYRM
jgi:hypothetical protein